MKKWCWLWLIATLIDAGVVIYNAISASGATPEIIPFDFSRTLENIPYWLDSIWYVFNIVAINGVFAWFGYLLFKSLKATQPKIPNFSLFIFLYITFAALMILAKQRFNVIYPSYLYAPINFERIEESLWLLGMPVLVIAALGYIFINYKYWKSFLSLYIVLVCLSYYPYLFGVISQAKDVKKLEKPNVVYILLDAVRPDHMKASGAPFDIMPKLNKMIEEQGVYYKDVTVSVARSFPSAVAILTGKHAINNGARDNLFAKKGIAYTETLAHVLRDNGYQTIAANDAIQFWNIDKDYGFDDIWSAGQSSIKLIPLDIGGFMPLPLLFANTRIGEIFFPYSYSDRNIDNVYKTSVYIDKVDRELNFLDKDKPLFMFMSMELTHTPYADENPYSRRIANQLKNTEYYDACDYFLASMNEIDDQLFNMLDVLKKHGRLDNTILIIGSDHGQGFSMDKDVYVTYQGDQFKMIEGFYGNNGINPSSTNLMLSIFDMSAHLNLKKGIREDQLESIDIMPTILDLLTINDLSAKDGESFKASLKGERSDYDRIRFVESGFKSRADFKKGQSSKMTELSSKVRLDLNLLVQEWNQDGRLVINLNKDRAVYFGDWALMTQDFLGSPYVFNQKEKIVWPIAMAPSDAPIESMLKAWCDHYSVDADGLVGFNVTKENIAQGYCVNERQNELIKRVKENGMYDSEYYRSMARNVGRSTQFFCTREHLY